MPAQLGRPRNISHGSFLLFGGNSRTPKCRAPHADARRKRLTTPTRTIRGAVLTCTRGNSHPLKCRAPRVRMQGARGSRHRGPQRSTKRWCRRCGPGNRGEAFRLCVGLRGHAPRSRSSCASRRCFRATRGPPLGTLHHNREGGSRARTMLATQGLTPRLPPMTPRTASPLRIRPDDA